MLAWEINGSKGSIAWDLELLNVLRFYRASGSPIRGFTDVLVAEPEYDLAAPWWPSGHILSWEHGHVNMIAHFLEAVADDRPIEPYGATFKDGAKVALISEAARKIG
jgi:predicted dehydrogenase